MINHWLPGPESSPKTQPLPSAVESWTCFFLFHFVHLHLSNPCQILKVTSMGMLKDWFLWIIFIVARSRTLHLLCNSFLKHSFYITSMNWAMAGISLRAVSTQRPQPGPSTEEPSAPESSLTPRSSYYDFEALHLNKQNDGIRWCSYVPLTCGAKVVAKQM